jgi:hypothetical protein
MKKTKLFPLLALTLIVSAFLFAGTMTAYAAADPAANGSPPADTQTLSVDEVWLTGDILHIAVTDKNGGENQTLELNLSDYAKPGDEYVTVQATDNDGRTSNAIQFKNPYYVPQTADNSGDGEGTSASNGGASESAVPDGTKPTDDGIPFTPDGTGSVVDNATDGDGKEFFTVETPDGNVFYLIVDRQRNSENVYLLNAVTENDLASLAKPGDGKSVSAVETPTPPATSTPPETSPEPTTPAAPEKNVSDNTGTIIFIVIAVLVVGGAGYYFKIVRPKQLGTTTGAEDYDEPEDDGDFDDDEEIDVTDGEGEDSE